MCASWLFADVDEQFIEAVKLSICEEFQKYVVLVMDEMHIKEDLVYDKHSGELTLRNNHSLVQFSAHTILYFAPNVIELGYS